METNGLGHGALAELHGAAVRALFALSQGLADADLRAEALRQADEWQARMNVHWIADVAERRALRLKLGLVTA